MDRRKRATLQTTLGSYRSAEVFTAEGFRQRWAETPAEKQALKSKL
jgi:hypothetical protein